MKEYCYGLGIRPIIGANAIDFLSQVNDSSYTLTWSPAGAGIATSEDLGYSYGIYKLELKDTVLRGTYVSIWKKQKDGTWKFILDSGNEGIGSPAIINSQWAMVLHGTNDLD